MTNLENIDFTFPAAHNINHNYAGDAFDCSVSFDMIQRKEHIDKNIGNLVGSFWYPFCVQVYAAWQLLPNDNLRNAESL